jgi:hypothetical protein
VFWHCYSPDYNKNMSSHVEPEWGEASFRRDHYWYGHLPRGGYDYGDGQETYSQKRAFALANPEYDLFDEFMPTGRPKHDIGRYVMRHNVRVPLIKSMKEWQLALMRGEGMIRSEHPQDYAGYSGLYSSETLGVRDYLPKGEMYDVSDPSFFEWNRVERTVSGPVRRVLDPLLWVPGLEGIKPALAAGLYDGTIDPSAFMRLARWNSQYEFNSAFLSDRLQPSTILSSRWRNVPGKNIRVMRDPVIEGKYFIGGDQPHHHWEITEGRESGLLNASSKGAYRGYSKNEAPEYQLPSDAVVDLYEKIRTLPFFDNTQVPVLELQYGEDGSLYFLQYLKTGLRLDTTPKFRLPTGQNIVKVHDVKGATSRMGEKLRIYLDPMTITERMNEQAFWVSHRVSVGDMSQVVSLMGKVILLDYFLGFKNNHFDSAPLTRAPVALGLYDGVGEGATAIGKVALQQPRRTVSDWHRDQVEYIDAVVTSNGRQATIESDWQMRVEPT